MIKPSLQFFFLSFFVVFFKKKVVKLIQSIQKFLLCCLYYFCFKSKSRDSGSGSPESFKGLVMAQQCLSVVFVRLRLEIWAQRGFFVVGGWKHVSGLHLIG